MGAYNIDKIENDFRVASKGRLFPVGSLLQNCAELILMHVPDNNARDMAISHLLSATDMVLSAYALHNQPVQRKVAKWGFPEYLERYQQILEEESCTGSND